MENSMNKRKAVWIVVQCVLLTTGAVRAGAQEQALNLALLKTFIRTQNDVLNLYINNPVQAFLPTAVDCPTTAKRGCTLEIKVDGQFAGNDIQVAVAVSDGSGLPGIDPAASIVVCGAGCNSDTEPFQWMQRGIPAGTKATVTVEFENKYNSSSQASNRTETIQLFKN
jgi:hypothetical protein